MKRIYSLILLFSFLVGMVQPVLPMVDYLLYEDGLAGLLGQQESVECCLLVKADGDHECSDCPSDPQDREVLLDDNYYPIPIGANLQPGAAILPEMTQPFIVLTERVLLQHTYPISPPPRKA
ncbi:MAG: hypothetical protein WD315_04050 [Balneolaceae bacterium]